MNNIKLALLIIPFFLSSLSHAQKNKSNREMIALLKDIEKKEYSITNPFVPEARLAFYDSLLKGHSTGEELPSTTFSRAQALLEAGEEQQSIDNFEKLMKQVDKLTKSNRMMLLRCLAMAYIRLGERTNCLHHHNSQSCIFPIQSKGVHADPTGSSKAIDLFKVILKEDPEDLESRWLLNIAYMTIGQYPKGVPPEYLLSLPESSNAQPLKPFTDAAMMTGLNTNNQAGGSIIEDFNNDNYPDIITSSWSLSEGMHYNRNNGDGTFTDISAASGLADLVGGLNIMQTDYNNDGFKDIFVLRGAWKGVYGKEPNSLLRNNGDGTFTDVTKESGLLSFHPTQTATWNDFNNDGWLDVFIGNESTSAADPQPSEFYINNGDGTFKEMSSVCHAAVNEFVKGVVSGDYNNDGWPDLFISILGTRKILLQNMGVENGIVQFKDVTKEAGLGNLPTPTFPTAFFDYNNDGWLDILVCSYEFKGSLALYAAAEALDMNIGNAGKQFLFRNKGDGTFENVSDKSGLGKVAFAMGMNFGDIDNDGYPDLYLGTGNPHFQSLVPNKMFRNIKGQFFNDVTSQARVGNLQKGHGVSFADLDNDGDEDIHIDMGGAFPGDPYQSSFYINPGQNSNNWINLNLEGVKSNKAAIGAKIKVTFKEDGVERSVYRDVNSGGSFGSNPLTQHIGIGSATTIESIEIKWPQGEVVQVFRNLPAGQTVKIKEGNDGLTVINLKQFDFMLGDHEMMGNAHGH